MDKYWEQLYEIILKLLQCRRDKHRSANLFSSKLCLAPSNNHLNNLKDYRDFAEENKQYDSSESQHDSISQRCCKLEWFEKRRLIESFHQTDLTEIKVINKNIKGLNRRTNYQTFKQ